MSGDDGGGGTDPLLELREVSVRFGGHVAVDAVDLQVPAGAITGLIGPNGAGKTTTFNVITGLQAPTSGQVLLGGVDITKRRAHRRAQAGIGRTFQRLEVFGSLTARENILVGAELRRRWSRRATPSPTEIALLAEIGLAEAGAASVPTISAGEETDALVELVGIGAVAGTRADELPTGLARLVELGRALASRPRLLLLDEPASGQDEGETESFARLLTRLAGTGMGILLVEHDVPLVMQLCQTVCVLDFGAVLASGTPAEVQSNQAVMDAYLGAEPVTAEALEHVTKETRVSGGAPVLELRGVRAAYGRIEVLHGVDLVVPAASVVALLGPNGAGKSTSLKVASGQMAPTAGCVHVLGRHVNAAKPDALARMGICTIPEGRGIFPSLTVRENLRMVTYAGSSLAHVEDRAFTQFPRLKERIGQVAGTMSGGEQQMLAMARALGSDPALLLLDELSMGLAPLIVEELYGLVADIARQGVSILVVEQFARAVLGVADVAVIMQHGKATAAGSPADLESELSAAYLGAST